MNSDRKSRNMEENEKGYTFKPFHETYKLITVGLTLGLLYPNPATEKLRLTLIVSLLVIFLPVMSMILIDMYECWLQRDMFNIIRHSTIVGPFMGAFFKMFVMYYTRAQAKQLIDELTADYLSYNALDAGYQRRVRAHVQRCVCRVQYLWAGIISSAIMMFPAVAMIGTLYSHIFHDIPQKYMVHDLNKPFAPPEARFESPYYEILFAYMLASAFLCVLNYSSYDGFFGVITNHACLKMTIYCKRLEDAFRTKDSVKQYEGILKFIEEQGKMFRFTSLIQDTFNIWLGTIIISTMIQIGSLLFHISAGYGFDLRYTLFSFTSVVHIFLPCKYAATLKSMSAETSTLVFTSGWENATSPRIRRMIPFLVARAQIPVTIRAFYLFQYDMELFVNIMRTSYSMFTLLRS